MRNAAPVPTGEPSLTEVHEYTWRDVRARFWPLIQPHRWYLIAAGVLVSGVGLAVAVTPLLPKYIIDVAIPQRSIRLAAIAAGIFLLAMFVRMTIWYVAMRLVYWVQQSVICELRKSSFQHLQQLCLRFHSRYPSGFLYERVFGNSINALGGFLAAVFQQLATYLSGLIFSLGFCLYLSPVLTLAILLGAAGYVMAARRLSRRIYQKHRVANEAGMQIVALIMDKLRGVKTVQATAMEDLILAEFDSKLWPSMRKWMDAVLESMKLGFVTEGLSYGITATVVTCGAALVIWHPDTVKVGVLVAFMGYQGMLIGMMQSLTNMYGQFMSAKTAFDQLFTILDTTSTVAENPAARMPARVAGELAFDRVTFAYEEQPVLQDLCVRVPCGQSVALVGRSGSGKSTVLNLLMRFFDPQSGALRLDGQDICELPLRGYRGLFSVVLQDPYLFDTTIAANLRYVRPQATDAELIEVLKKARAWDFVSRFPDGLQQRVGEAGGQVSGGQRQRLAIARCMLMARRYVLLDEATSALDVESEQEVQESMRELFTGRSVFVIAHRLSTIRNVDRILVMDQGRLVEDGSFDALLERRGLFWRLHMIATSTSTHRLKLDEAGFA